MIHVTPFYNFYLMDSDLKCFSWTACPGKNANKVCQIISRDKLIFNKHYINTKS